MQMTATHDGACDGSRQSCVARRRQWRQRVTLRRYFFVIVTHALYAPCATRFRAVVCAHRREWTHARRIVRIARAHGR